MSEDQTQFASGSLLYEPISQVDEPGEKSASPNKQVGEQRRPVLLGIAILAVVLILVALFALWRSRQRPETKPAVNLDPETKQQLVGPFTKRLRELQQDLEKADPSQEDLPFPPVDLELSLED